MSNFTRQQQRRNKAKGGVKCSKATYNDSVYNYALFNIEDLKLMNGLSISSDRLNEFQSDKVLFIQENRLNIELVLPYSKGDDKYELVEQGMKQIEDMKQNMFTSLSVA